MRLRQDITASKTLAETRESRELHGLMETFFEVYDETH